MAPRNVEVRAALKRITRSRQFRASVQLTAFLRFVVGRTLAGRAAEIKSYTIAVEALGRAPSFDPQTDAIVRVEAGRLRRALALYYADAGRDEPVVMQFPRGSYVPLFHRSALEGGPESGEPALLQVLFDRLAELNRQIEIVSADIQRAWKEQKRPDGMPPRRD